MTHRSSTFKTQVYICDTDCYGVVWHGNYLRWLEMGRCVLLQEAGVQVSGLPKPEWVYPIVEQHLVHKTFARLNDELEVLTELTVKEPKLLFKQTVKRLEDDAVCLQATITLVVLDSEYKLQRRLPAELKALL